MEERPKNRRFIRAFALAAIGAAAVFGLLALLHVIPLWLAVISILVFMFAMLFHIGATYGENAEDTQATSEENPQKRRRCSGKGLISRLFRLL